MIVFAGSHFVWWGFSFLSLTVFAGSFKWCFIFLSVPVFAGIHFVRRYFPLFE